jgi:DNA-binding beta-propeller fold protein YncE
MAATIGMPTGVAVDSSGNVYIADCTDSTGSNSGCIAGNVLKVSGVASRS